MCVGALALAEGRGDSRTALGGWGQCAEALTLPGGFRGVPSDPHRGFGALWGWLWVLGGGIRVVGQRQTLVVERGFGPWQVQELLAIKVEDGRLLL